MVRSLIIATLMGVLYSPVFAQESTATALNPLDTTQPVDLINELHQRQWVRLDQEGKISGKLFVLTESGEREARAAAKIVVSKQGKPVVETKSDDVGKFLLEGLAEGTYALQVRGDVTFAAYALHVLPQDAAHLTSEVEVFAAMIPAKRAMELINSNLTPSFAAAEDVYYREFSVDPIRNERIFSNSHRIKLRDGNLVGRVSRPGWTFSEQDLTGSVAQIVRNGKVVAKASVGQDGYFIFGNLQPGVYDLFVSGDDGFAVLAFEAVAEDAIASSRIGARFVASQVGMASDRLNCELVQQPEVMCGEVVMESLVVDDCSVCDVDPCGCGASPMAGGGMVGGGFGGGGGGGGLGGGGFGALAGVAGLAVGIAALSDDDDGFNQNVSTIIVP